MGGGAGKGTANLVDANPSGVITLDPSIKFYDYGGATDFYGQVEVVQAFDAASFVSQILSQPGQSKVLVVDGGASLNSALFDAEMANNAMRNGWKGVVVYGAVRNSGQLSKTQFGVKALGTNPLKGRGANGQRGVGVTIGSTQLQSGLWLFADQDGIVISQSDVSGGSFGGGSSSFGAGFGSSSSLTGGYGSPSTLTGGYGSSSSLTGGYGASSLTGGYGASSSLTGGYGSSNSMGGSSYGASAGTGYGSSPGSSPSIYGSGSYGSGSYSSNSPYSYGRSTYSYSSKKKKHKMFKILLATSIAAIVWIVCLR
jgi:regulator of ribonuclease activity A